LKAQLKDSSQQVKFRLMKEGDGMKCNPDWHAALLPSRQGVGDQVCKVTSDILWLIAQNNHRAALRHGG
jgi:hypothetical protein